MNHLKLLRSISGNNVAVVVENTQKNSADNNNKRKKDEQKLEREMASNEIFASLIQKCSSYL